MAAPVISVCCPTRGRPESMRRLAESIRATAAGEVELVFYIDLDDGPSCAAAVELGARHFLGERIVLSDMWNACAAAASGDIVMQCADDIVFRTPGWDLEVEAAFARVPDRIALVYGNDLVHGPRLGTHGFIHRAWMDAVGYMLPPGFSCDMSDLWVNEVAEELGRRVYLPRVITEHMHPSVGKGRLDQTHRDRLARGRADDVTALYAARAGERAAHVAKLRAVIEKCDSPIVISWGVDHGAR